MKSAAVCLFGLILAFNTSLAVAAPELKSDSKATDEDREEAKKKKIGVDQSDFMPDANSFGFIVSYSAAYNDLEQVDNKTVGHRVNFAGTYSFDKHWSAYSAVGASHESFGTNIVRDNDNDQFHRISNLNLGVVYTKNNPLSFISRSSNTLNVGAPVSERSRIDKHIANISLTNFMQTHNWKKFSLFNRFTGNFLWNTQRFTIFDDPQSNSEGDQLNRDWLVSNSLGVTYMILPRLGARFNYRVDMVRLVDGSWNMSFGDNLSIFTNISGFQIFLTTINNSYLENERIDLGYYDKFRRVYLGGVTYAF